MTREEFIGWADRYCLHFGLSDREMESVVSWCDDFCRLYTLAEIRRAEGIVKGSGQELRWVGQHFTALVRAVNASREWDAAARGGLVDESVCVLCRGSGWVSVPHPGYIEDGGRRRYRLTLLPPAVEIDPVTWTRTMSVACGCELGRNTVESEQKQKRQPMTLSTYEMRFPNWREIQFEREAAIRAKRGEPSPESKAEVKLMLAARRTGESK